MGIKFSNKKDNERKNLLNNKYKNNIPNKSDISKKIKTTNLEVQRKNYINRLSFINNKEKILNESLCNNSFLNRFPLRSTSFIEENNFSFYNKNLFNPSIEKVNFSNSIVEVNNENIYNYVDSHLFFNQNTNSSIKISENRKSFNKFNSLNKITICNDNNITSQNLSINGYSVNKSNKINPYKFASNKKKRRNSRMTLISNITYNSLNKSNSFENKILNFDEDNISNDSFENAKQNLEINHHNFQDSNKIKNTNLINNFNYSETKHSLYLDLKNQEFLNEIKYSNFKENISINKTKSICILSNDKSKDSTLNNNSTNKSSQSKNLQIGALSINIFDSSFTKKSNSLEIEYNKDNTSNCRSLDFINASSPEKFSEINSYNLNFINKVEKNTSCSVKKNLFLDFEILKGKSNILSDFCKNESCSTTNIDNTSFISNISSKNQFPSKLMEKNEYQLNYIRAVHSENLRKNYIAKLIYKHIWEPSVKTKNHNSIIIFDWDDTLLCTSYLTPTGIYEDDKILSDKEMEIIYKLEFSVLRLLTLAIEKGDVYIVTNAAPGWVEYSAEKYYPSVRKLLNKLKIISARGDYEKDYPGDSKKWKIQAFLEMKINFDTNLITNIMCLGDSFIEMEAAQIFAKKFKEAYIKSVKFRDCPKPEELNRQLSLVSDQFITIFSSIKNLTIRVEKKIKI